MSRLDDWAARISGVWEPRTEPAAPPSEVRAVLETTYEDTKDAVAADELVVVGDLAELIESRMSPLEAARALFHPTVEEATDVA